MKKVFLILLTTLNLISCQQSSELNSDKNLTIIVKNIIANHPQQIDLSNIRNLDYDKLLILEPYTTISETEKELKIDLSNISENKIYNSDNFNLLIFLKENKILKICELPRSEGDFLDYKIVIDRKNTVFEKNEKGIISLKK